MSQYIMQFSPSEFGTHVYNIEASSDEEALNKAVRRLEASPCSSLQYTLIKVESTIVDWTRWTRKS